MNKPLLLLEAGPIRYIRFRLVSIVLLTSLLAAWTQSAQAAASGSWGVNANGNWTRTANWVNGIVANGAGRTATFNRAISATRTITLDANFTLGKLVFGNSATFNGNNWTIGGTNTITLDNSGAVSAITCWPLKSAGNSAVTISTPLSSSLGLTKLGSGTLWLGGNNSGLSGTLTISAGSVYNNNASGLGTMNSIIASGSYLSFWTGGTFSQNFALNGIGASQDGVLKNTLYADSTTTGSGGSFTINGTVTLNADSDIGGSSPAQTITLNGPVTGTGGLIKAGSPTLILNEVNTYTGATTISGGTLAIGGSGQLGGGNYAANIANNGAFIYNSSATQSLSGDISGSGDLTKTGAGILSLSGHNTYAGVTAISSGVVKAYTVNAFGSNASGTTVGSGGSIYFLYGPYTNTEPFILQGDAGAVTNQFQFGSAVAYTLGGQITLDSTSRIGVDGTSMATLSGKITGPGGLHKVGGDLVINNNANDFTGGVTIISGSLVANANAALGAGLLTLSGGTLSNSVGSTLVNNVNLVSATTVGVAGGSVLTLSGVITNNAALTKAGAGTLTLSVSNAYTGGTVIADGTVKLGHTNALGVPSGNYLAAISGSGQIDLNGIQLDAGSPKPISVSGAGMAGNSGAIVNTGTGMNNHGVKDVTLTGNASIGNDGNRFDIVGVLSGAYTLTKVGNNTLYLGGGSVSNNVAGFVVNGGTLGLSELLGTGTPTVTVNAGGTLQIYDSGGLTFPNSLTLNNGTLDKENTTSDTWSGGVALSTGTTNTVTVGGGQLTISGIITGNGYLTKSGPGLLWLSGANSSLSSAFAISAGAVYNNNASGLGTMSVSIASGSYLSFWTGGTFSQNFALNGIGTNQAGSVKSTLYADSTATGSEGSFTINGTVTLNATSDISGSSPAQVITFNGPVAGAGGLIKTGQPTLTLNASNTYTGGTTINQGTLALGSAGSLANTLNIAIAAGATFDVSAIGSYAVSSNTGLFYASGTGTAVGSTAAALKGAAGGTVSLGSCPIELVYDGLNPALYVSQGTLSLAGNDFIVNSGSPLGAGTYTIVQQAAGNISASGSFSVTGTAIGSNMSGLISLSGGNLNLVVQQIASNLTASFTSSNATVTYFAAPGFQDYSWNSLMCVLQRSTNLSSWVSISTNVPVTNGWIQIVDNFTDLGGQSPGQVFYRVVAARDAQNLILTVSPAASIEQPFNFNLPAGPQFTAAQTNAQYAAGAAVLPLVQQAFATGAASVRIPPGDYRFGQETWGPNGVIYPLQFSGLQRDAQHPFTIDATGATFWFDLANDQSPTAHFCVGFVNCSNIIFYGATIDRSTRGHVEGMITDFDFLGNRIELQLSPGCTLPTTFNDGPEQRLLPFKADGTFCAPLYALQAGGTKLKYASITSSATPGRCWVTLATTALLATNASASWYNAYGEQGVLRVGDGLSCIYAVSSALELVNSANLSVYGVRDFAPKAWGAEWYGAGKHLWKDCYFGPRPGTSQWQGGEGFLFSGTGRGSTLDHLTMLHTGDDMANFHGYWSEATSAAGNQVTFTNHAGNFNLLPPDAAVSNTIVFYNRNSGARLGQGIVTALTSNTVTLDVSATSFANSIARWPEHECANWVIQNCNMHDNYQRVLMQSGPGLIQNNTFARNGSCLEFNFDFTYIEGGIPNNIVIANNTFTNVAPMPGGATINYHEATYGSLANRLISNLTITGNTIGNPGDAGINLLRVNGGSIVSNNIVNPVRYTKLAQSGTPPVQQAIYLSNCANFSVLSNNVSDLGHYTAAGSLTGSYILGIDASCQNITNLDGSLQW